MSGYSSITKCFAFRLPNDVADGVDALARQQGLEKSKLLRQWISEAYSAEVEKQNQPTVTV